MLKEEGLNTTYKGLATYQEHFSQIVRKDIFKLFWTVVLLFATEERSGSAWIVLFNWIEENGKGDRWLFEQNQIYCRIWFELLFRKCSGVNAEWTDDIPRGWKGGKLSSPFPFIHCNLSCASVITRDAKSEQHEQRAAAIFPPAVLISGLPMQKIC